MIYSTLIIVLVHSIADKFQNACQDFLVNYEARDHFLSKNRCDETVDIQRCVRDSRFKYIRNFMSYVPHMQPNKYKDGKRLFRL